MKIKILLSLIITLICTNLYFLYEYNALSKELACCSDKYNKTLKGVKSSIQFNLMEDVNKLILLFNNPDFLKLILHANASVYFEEIGANSSFMLENLDKNSTLCLNWNDTTKEQLFEPHLDYRDANNSEKENTLFLHGLEIVDSICSSKDEN